MQSHIAGGEETNYSIGLNWYLNQNVRIGWNYIHSRVDGSDTSAAANIALMRIQIAF